MALTASVPAGKYGKAALEKLGVWDSVAANVAEAENVRAALPLVARGEAPLGIVYTTDAKAEPRREGRRHVPRGFASADPLSGRADGEREARRARPSSTI